MTPEQGLLDAFDGHDVNGVRAALALGADACSPVQGKLPVYWLLEQYERSDQLGECLRLLIEQGAILDDPAVVPVLLDDADSIRSAVASTPSLLDHRTTLVSAFRGKLKRLNGEQQHTGWDYHRWHSLTHC